MRNKDETGASFCIFSMCILLIATVLVGVISDLCSSIGWRTHAHNVAKEAARIAFQHVNLNSAWESSGLELNILQNEANTVACDYVKSQGAQCDGKPVIKDGNVTVNVKYQAETRFLKAINIHTITVYGSGTARAAIVAEGEELNPPAAIGGGDGDTATSEFTNE
ncbi:MAG: hypothetical protein LBR20_06575 [Propionibacteriaceae bacterium]|jgi:hypothetical protein|nr:hypothetical protein [Propionibacteriaceae bacterium]